MKFGRIDQYLEVDYDDIATYKKDTSILQTSEQSSTHIYLGATGWSNNSWKGLLYPPNAKANKYLNYYSTRFKTIELNSTFYGIPTLDKIKNWIKETPEDFKFCPKFPQSISHRKDFGMSTGALMQWFDVMRAFEHKLGSSFIQFPNYFDYPRLMEISDHLTKFSDLFSLTIELRNEQFYSEDTFEALKHFCKNKNIGLVVTDVAGRRDIYHHQFTTNQLLVRWVGNDHTKHNKLRLKKWAEHVKQWTRIGHFDLFFMVHHPDMNQVPITCEYICEQFKDSTNIVIHNINLNTTKQSSLFD